MRPQRAHSLERSHDLAGCTPDSTRVESAGSQVSRGMTCPGVKREAGARMQCRRCPRNGKRSRDRNKPLCLRAREGAVFRTITVHSQARRPAETPWAARAGRCSTVCEPQGTRNARPLPPLSLRIDPTRVERVQELTGETRYTCDGARGWAAADCCCARRRPPSPAGRHGLAGF
jgi:hypothetical protein